MPFDEIDERFGRELEDLVRERRRRTHSKQRGRPPHVSDEIMGKLAEEFTAGGSALVDVYTGPPGEETEAGRQIAAYCRLLNSGTIASGTWVFCRVLNGKWQIYAYDCG